MSSKIKTWIEEQLEQRRKYVAHIIKMVRDGTLNLSAADFQSYLNEWREFCKSTTRMASAKHTALQNRTAKTLTQSAIQKDLTELQRQIALDEVTVELAMIEATGDQERKRAELLRAKANIFFSGTPKTTRRPGDVTDVKREIERDLDMLRIRSGEGLCVPDYERVFVGAGLS